jgi:hypothetical protein
MGDHLFGIPAWNVSYSKPWTPAEEALLGLVPDKELAKRLGRTFLAVQARREIKHFPPVNPLRRRFTQEENALLKTLSDLEAARKLGRSLQVVAARRRYLAS